MAIHHDLRMLGYGDSRDVVIMDAVTVAARATFLTIGRRVFFVKMVPTHCIICSLSVLLLRTYGLTCGMRTRTFRWTALTRSLMSHMRPVPLQRGWYAQSVWL